MKRFCLCPFVLLMKTVACAPPQAVCNATSNCPDGNVCRVGLCVPPAPPTIASIDGDGSALAVNPRDGVAPPEGQSAPHRTRGEMIVTGTELDSVDACSIAQGDLTTTCDFIPLDDDDGGTVKRIALPAVLVPGLMTLALTGVAGEARAQVFLLQGEPGERGERGEAGPAGDNGVDGVDGAAGVGLNALVDVRPAGDVCPTTGVLVVGGSDTNGDGILDDNEVQSEEPLCVDTTGAIDCTSGVCVFASPIAVPDITVGGRDVVTALPASIIIDVPDDQPTLAAAVESLDGIAIPPGVSVTILLAAGTHSVPSEVVFSHPDGARVFIQGLGREATFVDAPGGFLRVERTTLGVVSQLTVTGDGDSNGIRAGAAAQVFVGSDITIRSFGQGLISVDAGTIVVFDPGPTQPALLQDNIIGAQAVHGYLQLGRVEVRDSAQIGILASAGFIDAAGAVVSGSLVGIHSNTGSRIFAADADASDNDLPFQAFAESYIEAPDSIADGATGSWNANVASTIIATGGVATVAPFADATSLVIGP